MALRTGLNLVWALYQEYFAVYKVGVAEKGIPLLSQNRECAGNSEVIFPVPAFTVISHGFLAGNKLAVQYKILSTNFWEVMLTRAVAYHTWTTSSKRYEKTSVGDSDNWITSPKVVRGPMLGTFYWQNVMKVVNLEMKRLSCIVWVGLCNQMSP